MNAFSLFDPLLSTLFFTQAVSAMSVLKGNEVTLFSTVTGSITFNNEAVVGARIKQSVKYRGELITRTEAVDTQGRFSFSSITRIERDLIPKEFIARQMLIVTFQNIEYLVWESVKRNDEKNSELDGLPLNLKCELSDHNRFEHLTFHSIETKCTWG